ncbi:MAG: single-strand DNA-binding protein [Actinomycetota bacterium]|nr:single-strand DNA-binding protein [Actinomycetota bacterium]
MNETVVTVAGNVATDPKEKVVSNGARVVSFRLASTERRFDKGLGEWRDGATAFYTVSCWRTLAENVKSSVTKGQPLVVHGRLRVSSYDDKEGVQRTSIDIEARALGHDLSWGTSTFLKATNGVTSPERQAMAALARELDEETAFDPATGEVLDDPHEQDAA